MGQFRKGDRVEYHGAGYLGGKPLSGRRGDVVGTYVSPTGRHMIEVDFGRGLVVAIPDSGPLHLIDPAVRGRPSRDTRWIDQNIGAFSTRDYAQIAANQLKKRGAKKVSVRRRGRGFFVYFTFPEGRKLWID